LKKYSYFLFSVALAFGSYLSANADTILLASYGTSALNPGVDNTATTYDSSISEVNNGSSATFNISPGSTWHAPIGLSSWVSFNPGSGPTSNVVVPNGDYFYNTTVDVSAADVGDLVTLTVLADDTLSVFLNGGLVLQAAGPMGSSNSYAKCSDVAPNCLTPFTFSFLGLVAGENTLTFDVKQVNLVNEGLDFSGTISAVPEPLSLALLGTGLLGIVGLSRRFVTAK
jgi:PEP-CTERM motif